jgi:hypothetical protein
MPASCDRCAPKAELLQRSKSQRRSAKHRSFRGTLEAAFLGRGAHPRLPRVPTDTSAAVAGKRGFACLLNSLAIVAEAARIRLLSAEPGACRLTMGPKRCEGR